MTETGATGGGGVGLAVGGVGGPDVAADVGGYTLPSEILGGLPFGGDREEEGCTAGGGGRVGG